MNTVNGNLKLRALALAIQAALIAMSAVPAHADDESAASLRVPTNSLQFGTAYVSRDSAKFGEYTGYNKDGGYVNGSFSIRGGDAYGDTNGTKRYELYGNDLGLTSRSAGVSMSDQGRWNIGINYDQLTHYTSDNYQTPYLGTLGGNVFTLPNFGTVANTRTMTTPQLSAFQTMDINNNRDNTSLAGTYIIDRQWNIKLDFNHLDQSGGKLMAFGSAAINGAAGEKVSILPMPTNSRTETVNLALNYQGDKGHATFGYFGSFYHDNVNGVRFTTWGTANVLETMGTFPSNELQQINFTGGYAFTNRTRIAGGLSFSRNTQNTPYAYDSGVAATLNNVGPMVTASPTGSLNGSVNTTHADIKLTDQTTQKLLLSGTLKYDDRNNRTSSNIYSARAIDGNVNNSYAYPNTPLSITRYQGEIAGDYRVDARQKWRTALAYDQTDRECNQYATGGGVTPGTSTSIPYAPGTNCVVSTSTKDSKFNATYRLKASEDLNVNVGYSFSARRTNFDQNARAAFISKDGDIGGANGTGTVSGINAGDYRGFSPYFLSSRNQNMLKAGANWQASDKLAVTFGGRYTYDDYLAMLGVQKGTSWGLNLDTTYQYREAGALTLYVTVQERTRDVTDQQGATTPNATRVTVPAYGTWTNKLKDDDATVGLNLKQGGLMGGKLEVIGDLTYSWGKSHYETALNYQTTTTGGLTCASNILFTCGEPGDIKNTMLQFKLTGNYKLEKNSTLSLGYLYRNLNSNDFYNNGLIYGYTPNNVLPTNQTAPSYSVNMVFASYIYTFK